MLRRIILSIWTLAAVAILAACGNTTTPQASSPTKSAAAPPARTVAPAATLAPSPVATASTAATAATIPEGTTQEGYHVRGQAAAPVTLVMYSDFL
ncbi:MAG: hypothetical protein U0074_17785 [Kouleothrix sp.]